MISDGNQFDIFSCRITFNQRKYGTKTYRIYLNLISCKRGLKYSINEQRVKCLKAASTHGTLFYKTQNFCLQAGCFSKFRQIQP